VSNDSIIEDIGELFCRVIVPEWYYFCFLGELAYYNLDRVVTDVGGWISR
jgi:hypothetical protein